MANIRSIRQQDVFFGSGVSNTGPERRSVEKPLLYQAAESGDMSMLENLLAKGTDLDLESRHGTFSETALHAASDAGHLNVVKRLLEHGANLESRDSRDKTALHTASEAGHLDIVKWLLEHGADLESTNYQDKTALYIASESGQLEILQFLLQNHAKPDSIATYENQRNALHIASINGHLEIVELLLKNNLDPNVADRLEETALHHAAENGHSAVVKCLLDNGSKIDAGNWKKDTPLHLAASKLYTGHVDVVEVLIQSFNHPPSRAEYINKPNEYKETGLHRTASAGGPDLHKVKVIELLIRSGADLGARDYEGRTPLHKACVEHAGLDVMISLFNHSHVEINQLNGPQKGLQTCLHMAVEPPRIDIVRWLLENMSAAAVQLKDSENRSAWDKACEPLAWQKRHLFDTDTVRVMSAFVCRDRKVGRGRLLMDWGTRRNLGDSRHFDLPINSVRAVS
jgi:serine/threonine-protein phosphatase 6 regulatory ankyrin repeat subunit B